MVASWASSFAVRQPKAPLGTSQASLRPSLSTKNIKCKPRYKTDIKYAFPTHDESQINRASHTQLELDNLLQYSTQPIACSTHHHHITTRLSQSLPTLQRILRRRLDSTAGNRRHGFHLWQKRIGKSPNMFHDREFRIAFLRNRRRERTRRKR